MAVGVSIRTPVPSTQEQLVGRTSPIVFQLRRLPAPRKNEHQNDGDKDLLNIYIRAYATAKDRKSRRTPQGLARSQGRGAAYGTGVGGTAIYPRCHRLPGPRHVRREGRDEGSSCCRTTLARPPPRSTERRPTAAMIARKGKLITFWKSTASEFTLFVR